MIKRNSVSDVFKKNRYIFLTVLLIPVIAVIISLVLISYLGHSKLGLIYIILSLVMIQYLGLVAYIWRRLSS
jgi:hypothetical protein